MINFRFNDRLFIEDMMAKNYANKENPSETIRELARYNIHVLHMNKEDNYDAILEYMTQNCDDFYEEAYMKAIYRYISGAKKYKFRDVQSVVITKSELDKIATLNDVRKEKIAFVLLAIAKYYNAVSEDNNNRLYVKVRDIFKFARVTLPCADRMEYFRFAYEEDILVPHTFVGTDLKIVNIVSSNMEDEIILELCEADYLELAYVYLNYKNNGGYKRCKSCGRLFKMHKNSPGRLYCKECGQKEKTSQFKIIKCMDCGEDFMVGILNTKTCRCEECQKIVDIELNRIASKERMKRYRERQ